MCRQGDTCIIHGCPQGYTGDFHRVLEENRGVLALLGEAWCSKRSGD